jgi:hypothetical protein
MFIKMEYAKNGTLGQLMRERQELNRPFKDE